MPPPKGLRPLWNPPLKTAESPERSSLFAPPFLSHAVAKLCVCEAMPQAWGADLGELGGRLGDTPKPSPKGLRPLWNPPLKTVESPERIDLSGGGLGVSPRFPSHPLLLQEKGARGMRYQYFHNSWCWLQAAWGILSPSPWPVLSEVEVLGTSSAKQSLHWIQETLRSAQGDRITKKAGL
jgi:hypothetical protein